LSLDAAVALPQAEDRAQAFGRRDAAPPFPPERLSKRGLGFLLVFSSRGTDAGIQLEEGFDRRCVVAFAEHCERPGTGDPHADLGRVILRDPAWYNALDLLRDPDLHQRGRMPDANDLAAERFQGIANRLWRIRIRPDEPDGVVHRTDAREGARLFDARDCGSGLQEGLTRNGPVVDRHVMRDDAARICVGGRDEWRGE